MTFTVRTVLLAFAPSNMKLLDAVWPSAYGILLTHYISILWVEYAVYDYSLPAVSSLLLFSPASWR